uniref:Leukemia inhibitory factor n=1 Tax=Leptobrachium leishanense TaxID=445787 RepID=A0A8C5LVU3_9ANUR
MKIELKKSRKTHDIRNCIIWLYGSFSPLLLGKKGYHCNPDGLALNLSIQDLGKEETMVELHRISIFLRDALHNITLFQNSFFSKNTEWIATLNNVVMEFKVLISNLNCYLCRTNGWSQVATGSYHVNLETKTLFRKKVIGCRLIMKYKNFISQLLKRFKPASF